MDWLRMGECYPPFAAAEAAHALRHGEISDFPCIMAMSAGDTRDATSIDEPIVEGLRHRDSMG
jgi:hypothetical protein